MSEEIKQVWTEEISKLLWKQALRNRGMFLVKLLREREGEGPLGCELLMLPHFLDNRLTDGGKVVSLMRWLPLTHQEDSWYSFLLEAELTPGP
jgi:hypothetical protein